MKSGSVDDRNHKSAAEETSRDSLAGFKNRWLLGTKIVLQKSVGYLGRDRRPATTFGR